MPNFQDILATLPAIDHLERLELHDDDGACIARIENRAGTRGSLAVYHAIQSEFGVLDRTTAERALQLFSEHTEQARRKPGQHPNIDRLFDIIERDLRYTLIPVHADRN